MIPRLFSRTMRQFSTSPTHLDASAKLNKPARFATPISASDIPKGFVVSSTYAGIKAAISPKPSGSITAPSNPNPKPDLALIVSTVPANAAGTFTRNVFKAAPVVVSNRALERGSQVQSILVNSGCANAVTGTQGMADAEECVNLVKKHLAPHPGLNRTQGIGEGEVEAKEVLLLSTGVIGVPLPMPSIKKCLPHLANGMILRSDPESWKETARAFMTTDTFPKLRAKTFSLGAQEVRMIGIDKGAGMIHPAMTAPGGSPLHATMLGFIATDANVESKALQKALNRAVARSFNCISVDGDMSTNDTILLLANGQGNPGSKEMIDETSPYYEAFVAELTLFCQELSKLIVRDGEGAEKFVEITCTHAPSYEVAHGLLSRLVTSMLFKCAIHGEDANWGRILASVGGADPTLTKDIDPSKVSVSFVDPSDRGSSVTVLKDGNPVQVDEKVIGELLKKEDIKVVIDLKNGSEDCTYWTCDLSREYIAINADYRS